MKRDTLASDALRCHRLWSGYRTNLFNTDSPWRVSSLRSVEARTINRVGLTDKFGVTRYITINSYGLRLAKEIVTSCGSWQELMSEDRHHTSVYVDALAPGASISEEFARSLINDALPANKQEHLPTAYLPELSRTFHLNHLKLATE
jgi:hypothetical protein